jgi:hypothetical protein
MQHDEAEGLRSQPDVDASLSEARPSAMTSLDDGDASSTLR